jgi:hypothetical protein
MGYKFVDVIKLEKFGASNFKIWFTKLDLWFNAVD